MTLSITFQNRKVKMQCKYNILQ